MIGDIIKLNGQQKLLVLDHFNGNPFVICLNTGVETVFDEKNTNYCDSILRVKMKEWAKDVGVSNYIIPRDIDLTAMDGSKCYGCIKNETVAPLTFDEYRKYNHIIKPHIRDYFWTCTPWSDPDIHNWAADDVCYICDNGLPCHTYYSSSFELAPAFILSKNHLPVDFNPKPRMLTDFTTNELMAEIVRRIKETK